MEPAPAPLPEVVLFEPEIPQNAGNIARLCGAIGCQLHLVRPLGFFLDDRHMKRAGLDYWRLLNIRVHDSFEAMVADAPGRRLVLCTTKARVRHSDIAFSGGDMLVFGPESRGLPDHILATPGALLVRVPMVAGARSLNLANSVAVVAYEASRQLGYPGLTP